MRNGSKIAVSFIWLGIAAIIPLGMARADGNSTIQAVSVADTRLSASAGGNGDSLASTISADGRFVLFLGWANNLVTNDGNGLNVDVFLRNLTNHTTTLVSVNASGTSGGNGNSVIPGMSSDGRRVVFESEASDLVLNDTNGSSDVFVRDLAAGMTSLISVNQAGTGAGNGPSTGPVITPDGRFVAFSSEASDLVANDTNGLADIFVRDLILGTTILASPNAVPSYAGSPGSDSPFLTPDGRYLAFVSSASNLVSGITNNSTDVYVRDLQSGVTTWAGVNVRTLMQTVTNSPAASILASNPILSDDGHYVAFKAQGAATLILRHDLQTGATDLVSTHAIAFTADSVGPEMTPDARFIAFPARTNASDPGNVYLWDAQSGATALVSASLSGGASTNGFADSPALSADGRFIAFLSDAPDLAANATDGTVQVFVRDMVSGTTRLVSADTSGGVSGETGAAIPTISADGRLVAFDSFDGDYVPNDHNNGFDVFVRDTVAETTELVSQADSGLSSFTGNGLSLLYANGASADGRLVTFESLADDLVLNDTNGVQDIFVRDLQTASNLLISVSLDGGVGNGVSSIPAISSNGRFVVFTSSATNLVVSDQNRLPDIFVRDLQAGTTVLVSQSMNFNGTNSASANGESSSPVISGDGRYVAFVSQGTDLAPGVLRAGANVYWRDLQGGSTLALITSGRASSPVMSSDGRMVAYTAGSSQQLFVRNTQAQTNLVNGEIGQVSAYVLSADGRVVLFQSSTNTGMSIIAYDLVSGFMTAIGSNTVAGVNAMQISANGRFVTFVEKEPFAPGTPVSVKKVFLYDLESATTVLISINTSQTDAANGDSDSPSLSADGRFVAYRSYATDIIPNDNNGWSDVFVFDRLTGTNRLISVNRSGSFSGNGISAGPQVSLDGRSVVFRSVASDLVVGDSNETLDVFSWSNDAPSLVDADSDGMDDNWEIAHFGNLSHDGSLDSDGDGTSDLAEYRAGTDPMNPLSVFAVRTVVQTPGGVTTLSWQAAPGCGYRVQFKDDLANPAWTISPGGVTVIGSTASFTDGTVGVSGNRFYRVVVVE